ncbi:RNA 2',3'-cyclic phosphodiesterase [Lysobacter fragariae]
MQTDLFPDPTQRGDNARDTHNLFFALVPDETTCRQMEAVTGDLRTRGAAQGRWLNPRRFHMTLHFLGTFHPLREDIVAGARKAADGLRESAFELTLDRAGGFARNRVGWLGSATVEPRLQQLWEQLRLALAREQLKVEGASRFVPHVTVLRDANGPLVEQAVAPIHWPVREFVLIDSQLGSRNVYQQLGRWSLL